MNSQKLNGESTPNILVNEAVIMRKSKRSFIPANDYSVTKSYKLSTFER